MNDNYNYVLNNLGVNLTNNEWLMYVKNYFGEAETKNFCEYVIDARNICRKKDIRNMINITIKEIEKYLMQTCNSKVIYEVPYIKNKNIININKTKPIVELDYYSKEKQEKAKDFNPYSFNTAMLKMAFLQKFSSKEYNC